MKNRQQFASKKKNVLTYFNLDMKAHFWQICLRKLSFLLSDLQRKLLWITLCFSIYYVTGMMINQHWFVSFFLCSSFPAWLSYFLVCIFFFNMKNLALSYQSIFQIYLKHWVLRQVVQIQLINWCWLDLKNYQKQT